MIQSYFKKLMLLAVASFGASCVATPERVLVNASMQFLRRNFIQRGSLQEMNNNALRLIARSLGAVCAQLLRDCCVYNDREMIQAFEGLLRAELFKRNILHRVCVDALNPEIDKPFSQVLIDAYSELLPGSDMIGSDCSEYLAAAYVVNPVAENDCFAVDFVKRFYSTIVMRFYPGRESVYAGIDAKEVLRLFIEASDILAADDRAGCDNEPELVGLCLGTPSNQNSPQRPSCMPDGQHSFNSPSAHRRGASASPSGRRDGAFEPAGAHTSPSRLLVKTSSLGVEKPRSAGRILTFTREDDGVREADTAPCAASAVASLPSKLLFPPTSTLPVYGGSPVVVGVGRAAQEPMPSCGAGVQFNEFDEFGETSLCFDNFGGFALPEGVEAFLDAMERGGAEELEKQTSLLASHALVPSAVASASPVSIASAGGGSPAVPMCELPRSVGPRGFCNPVDDTERKPVERKSVGSQRKRQFARGEQLGQVSRRAAHLRQLDVTMPVATGVGVPAISRLFEVAKPSCDDDSTSGDECLDARPSKRQTVADSNE